MKKLIALLLAILMLMTLCACGAKNANGDDIADGNNKTAGEVVEDYGDDADTEDDGDAVDKTDADTDKDKGSSYIEPEYNMHKAPTTPEETVKAVFAYQSIYDAYIARGVDIVASYKNAMNHEMEEHSNGSFKDFKEHVLHEFPEILEEGWFDFSASDIEASELFSNKEVKAYSEKINSAKTADEMISVLVEAKIDYDNRWFDAQFTNGDVGSGVTVSNISKRELSESEFKEIIEGIETNLAEFSNDGCAYMYSASDVTKIYAMSFNLKSSAEDYRVTEDDSIFVVQTPAGCFFVSIIF